jgi:hypothetical protein
MLDEVCANAVTGLGAPSFGPHAVCANCAMVRSLSNAAAHEHASARKRQTSSLQTTYRGPTTEALYRPEPQKSARPLRKSINITWGTVLGGPVRVPELADRTIELFGVQAAKIHPYQQARYNLDAVEEGFRLPPGIPHTRAAPPKSFSKKCRSHACVSDFLKKVRSIPRSDGVYSTFILASFSGAAAEEPGWRNWQMQRTLRLLRRVPTGLALCLTGLGGWDEMSDVDQFAAWTSVTAKTRTSRLLGKLRLCTAF